MHSNGEKEAEDKGGGRAGPSGPLELFQRALLYLIKASQAPGNAPKPAIFLHLLQSPAGIVKERLQIKKKKKKKQGSRREPGS